MCVYEISFCSFYMLLLQCLAVAFMIAVMYANLTSCSNCKDDLMSYDQAAYSGVIMSAAAACCDDESDKITENLGLDVMSLDKGRKFAQLRSGCQCLNRDILQEIVCRRKDITSVSYLMANFPVFSKTIAEEILKIISQ